MVDPGSEFRAVEVIEPLFKYHKLWKKMRQIIASGVDYPLNNTTNDASNKDLRGMIERGNHRSALLKDNKPTLVKNYAKEVEHGWMLPVTIESLEKLRGAAVIPIGVAQQTSIDEQGERYTKRRTTHDASFPSPSGTSINIRLQRECLEPCFYGHCLLRLLHAIQTMRIHHPHLMILLIKYDLDSVYRRLHVVAKMAVLAITILKQLAYILLRLPFGVANGPSDYCVISEPIIDLANDILRDESWDPRTVHSPIRLNLDKPTSPLKDTTPFATARPLFVPTPYFPAVVDGYIDDLISVVVAKDNWVDKAQNAAPLAIHSVFRPTDPSDPLPRADAISERKLKGEGTPDEVKTILGWDIDTRLFRIHLPKLKAKEWRDEIKQITKLKTIPTKRLESTIGRLNHAGHIVPQGRYFLNRLRYLLENGKKFGPQPTNRAQLEDLELWDKLLQNVSTRGIDINNITFTSPTHITHSDACEHGIGGFCSNGKAWRFKLTNEMIGLWSINLLEFMAAAITVVITTRNSPSGTKTLAFTDNSSALGWLFKASFRSDQPCHDKVARWLAEELMERDSALYSQHIKGKQNFIADSLSRDHHIQDDKLTFAFQQLLPEQVPASFEICPPPPEVLYLINSLLLLSTRTAGSVPPPTKSKLGALTDGADSWRQWESKMSGWKNSLEDNAHTSCRHSQALVDEIRTAKQRNQDLREGRLSPPSHMFARPFGRIFGQIQP